MRVEKTSNALDILIYHWVLHRRLHCKEEPKSQEEQIYVGVTTY